MDEGDGVREVPAADVPEQAYLLDVREDDEWQAGHAPDAQHIALGQLGELHDQIPRDRDVYVICRSGVRSAHAAQALNAAWLASAQRRRRHARLGVRGTRHDQRIGPAVRGVTPGPWRRAAPG